MLRKQKKISNIRIRNRAENLSINRIISSKAEIKHTNNKINIIVYVFNKKKIFLLNKLIKFDKSSINLKRQFKLNTKSLIKKINFFKLKNLNIAKKNLIYFRLLRNNFLLNESIYSINKYINNYIINEFKSVYKKEIKNYIRFYHKILNSSFNSDFLLLYNKTKRIYIYNKIKKIIIRFYLKKYIKRFLSNEILYMYYNKIIYFNSLKLKDLFLDKLSKLISIIYNKTVCFNLINLKYSHLNSDIVSQSVTIKLKNRKNRLLKVLSKTLRAVKIISFNKYLQYDNKHKIFISKYNNFNLIFNKNILNKDKLEKILREMYLSLHSPSIFFYKRNNKLTIQNDIFNIIKYKTVSGIRLEGAGRLTRRLTASRSILKYRYKGTLKNIDSSYKNLSSVMLRNSNKSNVLYTNINSKTRNGSFGLKG